jgi:hypothetical protein
VAEYQKAGVMNTNEEAQKNNIRRWFLIGFDYTYTFLAPGRKILSSPDFFRTRRWNTAGLAPK